MKHEVLGVGTPILDHLLFVQDSYLNSIPGAKYGMECVTYPEMVKILELSRSIPKQIAGGSAANAIKGLAALGRKCALTGKIGTDAIGAKVIEVLQDSGVTPFIHYSEKPTAQVTCLVTPDGNRTCRTYLGASQDLTPDDLNPEHFHRTRLVHIEGYMIYLKGVVEKAIHLATEAGAVISYDLGSHELTKKFHDPLIQLLKDHIDIVFANDIEAESLTGLSAKESCYELQKWCSIAVVMIGKDGCYVGHNGDVTHYPAFPVTPIDTTGAGDLFASGFLHGYLDGKSLAECARFGAITGGTVVQIIGAEIPADRWLEIKARMELTPDE